MLLLYVYRLCAYLEVGNNLCGYNVVFSMNISFLLFIVTMLDVSMKYTL